MRPWWHVGIPFAIAGCMVGAIGLAGTHPGAVLFSLVLFGWGLSWSLRARRGSRLYALRIAEATRLLCDPDPAHVIWLGPATLLLRPRRAGHLAWTQRGFAWTESDLRMLADAQRRVPADMTRADLTLEFSALSDCRYETGALTGDRLLLECRDGETHRFGLPDPATFAYAHRAWTLRRPGR
jgi:hypothetical protein